MANRLETADRDLLNFRPNIDYVEPEVEPEPPSPVTEDLPQLEDVLERRRQVMKLAQAADILAVFMQARADEKAKNMVINLDSKIDGNVMQAMARRFPGIDPTRITYQQYRDCKDKMRDAGITIARKANITPDQINNVRDDAINLLGGATIRDSSSVGDVTSGAGLTGVSDTTSLSGVGLSSAGTADLNSLLNPKANASDRARKADIGDNTTTSLAGGDEAGNTTTSNTAGKGATIGRFNTEAAKTGGLRPELDNNMQIVDPIDMVEMQFSLICILVNFIWKNFILKAFDFKIPVAKIKPTDFLPKKLCKAGNVEAPDLILLGGKLPDLFTQKPPSLSDTSPEVEE